MKNLKYIFEYMSGKDLENKKNLENDSEFMKEVIKKDKKFYNNCSDELKSNIEFVKSIISDYSTDVEFSMTVANAFLSNCENDDQKFEINAFMSNITKKLENHKELSYYIDSNKEYEKKQMMYDLLTIQLTDRFKNIYGMGFYNYLKLYDENVLNFVAEKYLDKLFLEDATFEDYLHSDYEQTENDSVINIVLNYIQAHDYYLFRYLIDNRFLLEPVLPELERIMNNWDSYEKEEIIKKPEQNVYKIIIEETYNYMKQHPECELPLNTILYFVANEFEVVDKIKENDTLGNGKMGELQDEICDIYSNNDMTRYELARANLLHVIVVEGIFQKHLGHKATNHIDIDVPVTRNPKILEFKKKPVNDVDSDDE